MRGFVRLVVCVGILLGPQLALAAGGADRPLSDVLGASGQPPATEQLGQVVGSFTFPNPPIPPSPPYDNIPGLEHDGSGNLYCTDLSVPQFFVVDTSEPIAQLVDGPFAVATHSVTPKGITTDLVHVYVADVSAPADIDVYDLAGNYVGSFPVTSQTGFPQGITFSRITRDLYVVDGQGGNKVSEFTRGGDFVQNFTLNGSSQNGLAFDSGRCSYWVYDRGTDTVRHYDPDFLEIESFPGTANAGFGLGEGVAAIGDRLYVITAPSGWPTVIVFDVADAIEFCTVFADGFDTGDLSEWSGVGP